MNKNFFLRFFFLTACAFSFAETFRVKKTFPIELELSENAQHFDVGINDSLAIFLPNDMTFVDGIEIKILIPDEVAEWRDSVACSLYQNISPRPKASVIDYTGDRAFVKPLPTRASWIMQIPFSKTASFETSAYAQKIEFAADAKNGFIFVRFQPAMKGIPEKTFAAVLKISVKPILKSKGKLVLDARYNEKPVTNFSLFIDEKEIATSKNGVILPSGIHNLSLVSDNYRNEIRTIRIDKAKTTTLSISLKSSAPTLKINAPKNTLVFLDNAACSANGSETEISEGEHRIRFLLGDYEVVKTLHIQKGKTYSASLSIGIDVTEE